MTKTAARGKGYLREYRQWLWPHRWKLGTLTLLAIVIAGVDMLWPLVIRQVINGVLIDASEAWARRVWRLNLLGGLALGILIVKQALDSIQRYGVAVLDARLNLRLSRRLFEQMIRLPLGFLARLKTGGIVSRLSGDVEEASGLANAALIGPAAAVVRVGLTVTVLCLLSWRLAVTALVMVPPLVALSLFWLRKIKPLYRAAQADRATVDGRVGEAFGGVRVVRAFGREVREQLEHARGRHNVVRTLLRARRLQMVMEAGWGLLIPSVNLLIIWFGGYLVLRQYAKLGDIFVFQIYSSLLLEPVWQIVASISQTQRGLAAAERVFDVLAMDQHQTDPENAVDAPSQMEEIRLENVQFEYEPGFPVIRDVSLVVPAGSVVALVGPSGAGKTTLTDLIARFHDPTAGAIKVNGVDLRCTRWTSYRRRLAIVQQETFLFDGTIRENIAYGRPGTTMTQIIDAARRANAHQFIEALPEGYETIVGERGFRLSGGQKQRLSIARAIHADRQILILDEATSNLDSESEQLIQASLAELFKGRTTFVIAHRLSTVTLADMIVAMEDGRIREVGTHNELLRRGGSYADMVRRQQQGLGMSDVDRSRV
ncbi:MAG: ABC transporter ATP-binding protein [Tepidisphaeraceae bacterium]